MKKTTKRILGIVLSITFLLSMMLPIQITAADNSITPPEAITLSAPTKSIKINFWLDGGTPYYNVFLDSEALIENSKLGVNTSVGDFGGALLLESTVTSSGNETWFPVVGEKSEIRDHYNQAEYTLKNSDGKIIKLVMRAYDTGVAFKYILPEESGDYQVTKEYTGFVFPEGAVAQVHVDANQTVPRTVNVDSFASANYQRPMTIEYTSGAVLSICEANLKNYPVMVMTRDSSTPRGLTVKQANNNAPVSVSGGSPSSTPWRVLVIAKELKELPLNNDIVMNLNDAPNEELYKFSEWVKPGKNLMLGAGSENNETIKRWIDSAKENGLQYVLLDYGWYGPELDDRCDPRLDPTKLEPEEGDSAELAEVKLLMKNYIVGDSHIDCYGESGEKGFPPYGLITGEPVWSADGWMAPNLNMKEVCAYANSQGIGMILYVNGRHMFDRFGRYTPDELFARFEEWGAAGVKPGFVTVRDQLSEKRNLEMIETAAKHKLILTIHDEYVTTGIERTFPNCLTTEGILGDEGIRSHEIAEDISTLFTRAIQGPTDHTFCYPGKATRGYAVASAMMFRTGLNALYWYGNPNSLASLKTEEKKFWADLPANWDELKVLDAKMSSYATYARRSGDEWYLGSLSAVEWEMFAPLDFLDEGTEYVAEIYRDAKGINANSNPHAALVIEKYLVDSTTTLTSQMNYGNGYAARIRPKTAEDTGLEKYFMEILRLQELVDVCQPLKEELYTVSTWQDFAQALDVAVSLLDPEAEPTAQQLADAYNALYEARDNLRSVIVVIEQLNKAKCLAESHYSPETWEPLAAAVAAAREVLAKLDVTQGELDTAAANLKSALDKLDKKWLEADSTTYLSDLDWEDGSYSTYYGITRDKAVESPVISVLVNGSPKTFPKGIGVHAGSNIYYNLEDSGFEIFEAYVAIDTYKSLDGKGDVIFRVYSDDVLIYESLPSGSLGNAAQKISVPVANTKILRLEVDANGADGHDHADWADAKFLTMKEISSGSTINGIAVDGASLKEFAPNVFEYYYPISEGDPIPTISVNTPSAAVKYRIFKPVSVPGTGVIEVTSPGGGQLTYKVHFLTTTSTYLSDLNWDEIDKHGSSYGAAYKDKSQDNLPMQVTGADGENPLELPEVNGALKGMGMHADCSLTYYIDGKGYGRFEAWVGASHNKVYTNSMIFRVFFDDDETPVYESPVMSYLTPAEFISLDLTGVKKVRIMLDKIDRDNGDHGNWADAKFLTYQRTGTSTYLSDINHDSGDQHGSPYGGVYKDKPYEGSEILVTAADGESALDLPLVNGVRKGLGMHADYSVTYNIEGKNYARFETWLGASHSKVYNNSMIFKIFIDDEETPRYVSPPMSHLKPAEFVSLDLTGVKKIRLMLDKNGVDSGDHGNWADAKFITYDEGETTLQPSATFAYGDENAESVTAGETLTVSGSLPLAEDKQQLVISALYDASGALVKSAVSTATSNEGFAEFDIDLAIPSDVGDGAYVKVFVWDDTFLPILSPFYFPAS